MNQIRQESISKSQELLAMPEELEKWNWGAFWLTWIWGIANHTYISLLSFIPIVNFFMRFYLGSRGNQLAWNNKSWSSTDYFLAVQKKWNIAGWLIGGCIILSIVWRAAGPYKEAKQDMVIKKQIVSYVKANKEIAELIGEDYVVLDYMSPFLCIEGKDNKIYVIPELTEDKKIKKIIVSLDSDLTSEENKIIIYP